MKKVGVLAVQGAFAEHSMVLNKLNIETIEIRKKMDLNDNQFDGLILPGGESTTIGKLIHELDLYHDLKQMIQNGLPVLGTCAGMILLAKNVDDNRIYLGTMDISVKRNAYGRQLGSFHTNGQFAGIENIPMTFIRAPYIQSVSDHVQILATVNNHIVAAKQDNMIVTSFHPELTTDLRVHNYFLTCF